MSAPAPRLSICIATFNRGAFIGETLANILAQTTPAVELVVLDGGSTDNTREVVSDYQQRHDCVRYFRQDRNLGVDQDFDTAVGHARGEYCWLMSDDDLLVPGAMDRVLQAIEGRHALIILNAEVRNSDMSVVLQPRRLAVQSDRLFAADETDRLFADAGDYLTFIACVVIRRDIWMQRDRQSYYGSLFIHFGVIFQQPLPSPTLVIAQPQISIRYGNAMWRPREFEIWMFKWPPLVWSFAHISESARATVVAREPWRSLKTLLLYRARGTYSLRELRRWLLPRLPSRLSVVPPLLVALVPGALANLLAILYYRLLGERRGMGMLDIKKSRFYVRNWRLFQRHS